MKLTNSDVWFTFKKLNGLSKNYFVVDFYLIAHGLDGVRTYKISNGNVANIKTYDDVFISEDEHKLYNYLDLPWFINSNHLNWDESLKNDFSKIKMSKDIKIRQLCSFEKKLNLFLANLYDKNHYREIINHNKEAIKYEKEKFNNIEKSYPKIFRIKHK